MMPLMPPCLRQSYAMPPLFSRAAILFSLTLQPLLRAARAINNIADICRVDVATARRDMMLMLMLLLIRFSMLDYITPCRC